MEVNYDVRIPKPEQSKAKMVAKKFNQFPQREYAFEALEKVILGG